MFLLCDGIINAFVFFKEFLFGNRESEREQREKNIIKKYNNTYKLGICDRLLFYSTLSILLLPFKNPRYNLIFTLTLVTPIVQNNLVETFDKQVKAYQKFKETFFKWILSKVLVEKFQNLHPNLQKIQNYNTILIYNCIDFDFAYTVFTKYLIINLFYYLRNKESYYYYYKALKTAYFFTAGYSFENLAVDDSVFLLNIIIRESRWNDLVKHETMNAVCVLLHNETLNLNAIKLFFIKFFSVWSIISVMFLPLEYTLLVTSGVVFQSVLIGTIREFVFFTKNYSSIKKLLEVN